MTFKTIATKTSLSVGAAAAALILSSVSASAAVLTFTDQSEFQAAFDFNVITEEFNGPQSSFGGNSTANPVGSGITVDLNGPAGSSTDTGPTGLTGNGQLQAEVDSSGGLLNIDLNFAAPLFGFGFVIQNDSQSNPGGLDLEEIGVNVAGEAFLLSDILGLTNSSNGETVRTAENTAPQFFGFVSDDPFSTFTFVHGDLVASGGVFGNFEEFFLNSAVLAPEVPPVPLPAGGLLLVSGLAGMAALRRRKNRAA